LALAITINAAGADVDDTFGQDADRDGGEKVFQPAIGFSPLRRRGEVVDDGMPGG